MRPNAADIKSSLLLDEVKIYDEAAYTLPSNLTVPFFYQVRNFDVQHMPLEFLVIRCCYVA